MKYQVLRKVEIFISNNIKMEHRKREQNLRGIITIQNIIKKKER